MAEYNIPIVLFTFKRYDTVIKILDVLRKINAKKIYIISDGGRNSDEHKEVIDCREKIERYIDWKCSLSKNYADENKGIYDRIANGAKWVFSKEDYAIFLEDDNLPEETFFPFCEEMLLRYKDASNILWVCGTNYAEKFKPSDGSSYVFTRHMMPCGWASWSDKFNRYYDGDMTFLKDKYILKRIKREYVDKRLYHQNLFSAKAEQHRISKGQRPVSWDFQMMMSIRVNNVYGICPMHNQIKNIGVDEFSAHGGNSLKKPMTKRFCGINSYPLKFPLTHPKYIISDITYEKKIEKISLYPFYIRFRAYIARFIKKLMKKNIYESLKG